MRRILPLFLFNDDEQAGGATPPEPAAVTPPVEIAAPAEQPAPTPGDGPWAKDLTEFFTDEETRAQVDRFMREKYQPHVTKLEQESAPARALYKDLIEDPQTTIGALVGEIYGEGDEVNEALANRVLELLEQGATPEEAVAQADEEQPAPQRDPELEALLQERRDAEQAKLYKDALDSLRETKGNQFTEDTIRPYVIAADGDLDTAYEMMVADETAREAAFKAKYGIADDAPVPPAEAPAALGSSAAPTGGVAPPVAKTYSSFDDALDDFTAELSASNNAPTVVGS